MPTDQLREIDHIGVLVADLDTAGRFLAETFGLELDREAVVASLGVKARFYRCGPVMIEIYQADDPAVAESRLAGAPAKLEHIAIRVESLPEAIGQLSEHGVRWVHEQPIPTGPNMSHYTDPATSAGMTFQLFAPKPD